MFVGCLGSWVLLVYSDLVINGCGFVFVFECVWVFVDFVCLLI